MLERSPSLFDAVPVRAVELDADDVPAALDPRIRLS